MINKSIFNQITEQTTKVKYCDKAQLSLTSTTILTAINQKTIETVIQKHLKNMLLLSKKQQNYIAYQLVA
ncbi:16515_t:CDS:2 [Cetraspora pellucida]|uniref:16515_t:CDS:1 n=1 Tax=Cetraspora pellucida TaxID=1433469 RepID=A0A9N9H3P2_9GLOM|nr:16515_t:CDS:2 [Cetraspora pellucida]